MKRQTYCVQPSPLIAAAMTLLAAAACAGDLNESSPGSDDVDTQDPSGPDDVVLGEPRTTSIRFVPEPGVSGTERVNWAVPLPRGLVSDANQVRLLVQGSDVPLATRSLGSHADGTVRSIQVQADLAIQADVTAELLVNQGPAPERLTLVDVATTLADSGGESLPRVWSLLASDWLSDSGVAGQLLSVAETPTAQRAWTAVCDYEQFDTEEFLNEVNDRGNWLYDRTTTLYRGYARSGDMSPLRSAYREAAMYREGLSGTGANTRIGIAEASGDLKYHYTQGMAIHYLLTGDERFREAAEDVADRIADLWSNPGYSGGSGFWTERHAGFGLLGYSWAAAVSDDRRDAFMNAADDAVASYLAIQSTYPSGWNDNQARCFAHTAAAHAEDYGTWGCSPWMSAILAEGLEMYASERGGSEATDTREAIVRLGRILARDGRDDNGKPYYWMGVGSEADEQDPFDEHWGEPAYVIALAWALDGKTDATLRNAADDLVAGLAADGNAPHTRSFNWQCRGAVATSFYLQN